jgi:hypothetical protein
MDTGTLSLECAAMWLRNASTLLRDASAAAARDREAANKELASKGAKATDATPATGKAEAAEGSKVGGGGAGKGGGGYAPYR